MKILGDWAPGEKKIWSNLGNGLVLMNLEGPILPSNHTFQRIKKAGPNLSSNNLPENFSNLIFSLANNHIMDFGLKGLDFTLNELKTHNFYYCGAGQSIHEAREPLIIFDDEIRIAVISCCESQFGVAKPDISGVAEVGSWLYSDISKLSKKVDEVIISIHGGVEDSPWPSPFIRDLYHSFIDAGARLVHGHHSHIPQGYEEYNNGLILYGMGNFAVDPDKWNNYPNGLWSLGVDISFKKNHLIWDLYTYEIRQNPNSNWVVVEKSTPEEFLYHQEYLKKCNQPFVDETTFEGLWQEVALRAFYSYAGKYMNMLKQDELSLIGIIKQFFFKIKHNLCNKISPANPTSQELLLYYVMISCESHRQILITALGILSGNIPDLRNKKSRLLADEMMPWSRGIVP